MKLIFDETTHTYTDENGQLIPSVSEIIRNWLGNKYADIDAEVLKKAQEKGTKVHNEIEKYLLQDIEPKKPTYEFKEFKKILQDNKELGFKVVATHSEQTLYGATEYGAYAGTYDLFDSINGIIYDIKTNYSLDLEYVQLQLSLYAMALRQQDVKVIDGYVIHLPPEKSPQSPQIKKVELLSDEECENIVRAYFAGESKPQANLQCLNEQAIAELETNILAMEKAEMTIKEYKDKILKEMEERNINQIKIGKNITISYIAPTTRESIDTARFKKEMPVMAEKYKKVSNVKASVRITSK